MSVFDSVPEGRQPEGAVDFGSFSVEPIGGDLWVTDEYTQYAEPDDETGEKPTGSYLDLGRDGLPEEIVVAI